jgi:uncharacterized protein involved in type VI secretion and phage assembly
MSGKKHFGKHRGKVLNNLDPLNRGRILAQVASVSGLLPSTWCEPCLPLAGIQSGTYFVPQVGAGVWIEFEEGDVARPIWTGCFWGSVAEVPMLALVGLPGSPSIVLQTGGQVSLVLSDAPGQLGGVLARTHSAAVSVTDASIMLTCGTASIVLAPGLITISNGTGASIVLGPGQQVAVNLEALVVT